MVPYLSKQGKTMLKIASKNTSLIHLIFGYAFSFIVYTAVYHFSSEYFNASLGRLSQLCFLIFWLFTCFYYHKNEFYNALFNKALITKFLIVHLFILVIFAISFRLGYESFLGNFLLLINYSEELTITQSLDYFSINYIVSTVVFGPAVEEIFYRGALIEYFKNKYSIRTSVLISSVIFATAHMNPFVFISGVMLSMVYLRYGIISAIVVHSIGNLSLVVLLNYGAHHLVFNKVVLILFIILMSVFLLNKRK
jgi:membrane protease YdiL (CAAX protease family)